MSRRTALPGAAELFRTTGVPGTEAPVDADPDVDSVAVADLDAEPLRAVPDLTVAAPARRASVARGRGTSPGSQPTGRQRHDEKITVYVSVDELMALEQARLTLRGAHGMAVDRGRIVREALAVVLADLDAAGEASVLVRRLRER